MESTAGRSGVSPAAASLCDFFGFSRSELASWLVDEYGTSEYRADQLFEWVYAKDCTDFGQMTNIKRELREKLAERLEFNRAELIERQISLDGSRKYLFELGDGSQVESVYIAQPGRFTLCISSQVGCAMGCTFCRTGTMGLMRNLSTSEIIQQVRGVKQDLGPDDAAFANIVFMGMGEPLHNVNNVVRAVKILGDPKAFEFSQRKITVSTVGLVPAIYKFIDSGAEANLAISLNATDDQTRSQIMPLNRKFPLDELMNCIREIAQRLGRKKLTIEYVMLAGVNDSSADLKRLKALLKGLPTKVNLIPYNENAGLGYRAPNDKLVRSWQRTLFEGGIPTTVRWSKGQDISAACGQLATADDCVGRTIAV